jgi:flagellar biosynthesis protein FlhF
MQAKRFYSSSVEDAMRTVREQLGREAVVLSTDLVPSPGWRGWMGQRVVAVTAAVERKWSAIRPSASTRRQSEVFGAPARRADARASAARGGIIARLTATGVDLATAERIVAGLSAAECRVGTQEALRRELASAYASLIVTDARRSTIDVFVGPPGAGKTTTIAKIAAGRRVDGKRPPVLVGADGFRAGAIEHLRAYATVIGAPFRPARGAAELERALASCPGGALVDTAGRPPSDPAFRELWSVIAPRAEVRTHLVLAADTSVGVARRTLDTFVATTPTRVVITKLDEAESVAPLLAVLRERALPISFLASGQRVPEDLAAATADGLAELVLGPTEGVTACH